MVAKVKVSLASDIATVTKFYSTFYSADREAARDALKRHCTKEKNFLQMRTEVIAHGIFLTMKKASAKYTEARALACIDGTLKGFEAKVGADLKRTSLEESAYATGRSNWRYLLRVCQIETKSKKGGARTTPKVETKINDAPIVIDAVSIPRLTSPAELDAPYAMLAAFATKLQATNAKMYLGDKGSAYLALTTHIKTEIKRISSMKG